MIAERLNSKSKSSFSYDGNRIIKSHLQTGRNWCLGAETIDEMQQWIQALESVINKRSSIPNDAIKESTRSDLRDSYIKRSK